MHVSCGAGRRKDALPLFQQAALEDPNDPMPLGMLGEIAAAEGEVELAHKMYQQALNVAPSSGQAWCV